VSIGHLLHILRKLDLIYERILKMPTQQDFDALATQVNQDITDLTGEIVALKNLLTVGAAVPQAAMDALTSIETRLSNLKVTATPPAAPATPTP
jgi:hypothetical protein